MRNRDHHLQLRDKRYSIRYDIPTDLADCFPGVARTVREALGTGDKIEARKRRDRRLREIEKDFDRLRQAKKRNNTSATSQAPDGGTGDASSLEGWALSVSNSHDPGDMEGLDVSLADAFDRRIEDTLRQRRIPRSDFSAYEEVAREVRASPEGQRIMRALQIARGEATP
ncbi:MAG: DUF6538 domain-containing protein [Limibaculum sp.]